MKTHPHLPPGKLINIGNHRLHIYQSGEGNPAVVSESGGMSWCLDWHFIQTEAAKFTRVCAYDRAGYGWSEAGPTPRTCGQIVGELHTLLAKAEIFPPYILVGAPEKRQLFLEVGYQPKFFQSFLDELAAISASDEQVRLSGTLGNLPLTVIRHGKPEMFASMPAGQAMDSERVWQEQ